MKVTTIGLQNNSLSYKGLWGDTIKRKEQVVKKQRLDIYDCETKVYFPFAEESLQSVHNIMKENTTFKVSELVSTSDKFSYCRKYEGTDVRVNSGLLFTTKQWINYITNKLITGSVECNLIERNLKSLHLERYLRA